MGAESKATNTSASYFYGQVFRTAFTHSLDIAQAVIFVAFIIVGSVAIWVPRVKTMLDVNGWQAAAIAFGSIILIRLVLAPYWLWRAERHKIEEAKTKISSLSEVVTPKIRLSFEDTDTGCVRPNTSIAPVWINGSPGTITATFYRVRVDTGSSATVTGCAGRMTEIHKDGHRIVSGENIALTFAPGNQPDTRSKTIHPDAPEHLDFLAITNNNQIIIPSYQWQLPSSIPWNTIFADFAEYKFRIVVTSPECKPERIDIVLNWLGNHQTAKLRAA